jgi:hypothetical protein
MKPRQNVAMSREKLRSFQTHSGIRAFLAIDCQYINPHRRKNPTMNKART